MDVEEKICKTCGCSKSLDDFEKQTVKYKSRVSIYWANKCKLCDGERNRINNRNSKARNRKKLNAAQKVYYRANKKKISKYDSEYYAKNKERIKARVKKYTYNRRSTDVTFRLKEAISANVRQAVKKKNRSVFGSLPYTVQELKTHLEKQFESWMTWENYGTYRVDIWDDQDSSTWTWQIDHIIPHSNFKYESMNDDKFRECWALENLRPYSAKQNIIDGSRANYLF